MLLSIGLKTRSETVPAQDVDVESVLRSECCETQATQCMAVSLKASQASALPAGSSTGNQRKGMGRAWKCHGEEL